MVTRRNGVWAELVQLVPIISLALPFIVAGKVDISRAGSGFLLGALLTIPISAVIVLRKHLLKLLGLTVVILCWAWMFRHDIRLGGGLPFIVLNLGRRVLGRRASLSATAAHPEKTARLDSA